MNLLLTNANVYTVNPSQPRAQAIVIANDRIVYVGDEATARAIKLPGLKAIDMHGAFVLPGLIDAHLHLELTGFALQRVTLFDVLSIAEAVSRVKARAQETPHGTWIQGTGWNQADWGGDFPTAQQLDAASTDHPILLHARSGHAAWANTRALRAAGIDRNTADPFGGQLVRDASGEPTGALLETAIDLVASRIPAATFADEDAAVIQAMTAMNRSGLTGAHCMDGGAKGIQTFNTYQRLHENGRLTLRICKQLPVESLDHIVGLGLRSGFGDAWLRVGSVKIFVDGALGPRTAAMLEPYENEPDNRGISTFEKEDLVEAVVRCMSNGLSVTTHAIGDRANRDILDAYEIALKNAPPGARALRNRVEHAQVLHPDDLPRFAKLGVIASPQPIHATSDMKMADKNWGARAKLAYAWRSLLDSGARLAFGSDAYVEPFDPLLGLHAATTRQRADGSPGPNGWYPEQRVTIDEAIHAYTWGAAYAGYAEHETGSIEPGKLADLTVLSQDLTAIAPAAILQTKVEGVMIGGNWVYQK